MASVLVAADGHYYRDASGAVYVESVFNYGFYERYLSVFDEVLAVGRMTAVETAPPGKRRADGEGVQFLDLEPGKGASGYIKTAITNRKKIRKYLKLADCVIARVPGVVANLVVQECKAAHIPYALEVVVDPWEYFSPDARGGLINSAVRRRWTDGLKKSCLEAAGVSYVTEYYLQKRYPCSVEAITAHYSSVELPDENFANPRTYSEMGEITIAHAANAFVGNSKGHYTLFKAVRKILDNGHDVKLLCIGDGVSKNDYIEYVDKLGISDRVTFTGRLADGAAVRERISSADIFVFPTKAEGLPRVLLEAMAEGMPCLSTPVCGIPEILPREYLFDSNDSESFADMIVHLMKSPDELEQCSRDNLATAKKYASSLLQERRISFYRSILKTSGRR